MTAINYLGVRLGGAVQVFLTAIKITSVVIVIGVAFFAPAALRTALPIRCGRTALNGSVLSAFLAALAAALWAYDGWEDLNLVGSRSERSAAKFSARMFGGVTLVAADLFSFQRRLPEGSAVQRRSGLAAHRL